LIAFQVHVRKAPYFCVALSKSKPMPNPALNARNMTQASKLSWLRPAQVLMILQVAYPKPKRPIMNTTQSTAILYAE
jgi:hypothetical protein